MKLFVLFSTIISSLITFAAADLKAEENILSLLTLEEKIAVIANAEVSRLGISNPGRSEGIHQVVLRERQPDRKAVPTTSFFQVYRMGETWLENAYYQNTLSQLMTLTRSHEEKREKRLKYDRK